MFRTQKQGADTSANTQIIFTLLFFLTFLPFSILAQNTHYWDVTSGNWSDASNWDTGMVPASGDEVYIDNGGTVTYDVIGGGSIALLTLEDGTLTGNEQLTVVDEFYWYGGTISGTGVLEVSGSMYMEEANSKTLENKNLLITGEIYWYEGAFNVNGVGKLTIDAATFEIDLANSETIGGSTSAIIELLDGSELYKYGANTVSISCALQSNGATIWLDSGNLDFGASSSSNLVLCNLNTSAGTKLNFNEGTHILGNGTGAVGGGELNISGGNVNLNGNNIISIATINLSNGELGGTSNASLNSTVNWSGGTITTTSTITVFSTINLTTASDKTISSGTLQLNGTMNWSGGDIIVNASSNLNTIGGSNFNLNHTVNQSMSGSGNISIAGHVTKSYPTVTEMACNLAFSGSSFKLNNGTFKTMTGSSGDFSSSLQVASAAIFEVNGGTQNMNAGAAVIGSGTCTISGGTAIFASSSILSIDLILTGGILTGTSNLTPKDYTQSGGTFDGNGNPLVTGDMLWNGGTISGSGTFSVNGTVTWPSGMRSLDTKTLILYGDSFWSGGDFTFLNNGKIQSSTGKTMTIDHTGTVNASGSGMLEIDGTVKLMSASATTNLGIEFKLDGIMIGDGTFTYDILSNEGTVSPGISSLGKITVNNFDNTNGIVEIEVGGTGSGGANFDQLAITGTGTFQGTVNVSLINSFMPSIGDEFKIVDCGTCTGKFTIENFPALTCNNCLWESVYDGTGTVIRVMALLPVELIDFQAVAANEMADLTWKTSSEYNNRGFQIEQSNNGKIWKTVDFVEGSGNSVEPKSYSASIPLNGVGTFYFRLRQIDFDGHEILSEVRSVDIGQGVLSPKIKIAPNPNNGHGFKIISNQLSATSQYHFQIIDAQGIVKWEKSFEPNFNLNYSPVVDLSKGVYVLRVDSDIETKAIRFIVN